MKSIKTHHDFVAIYCIVAMVIAGVSVNCGFFSPDQKNIEFQSNRLPDKKTNRSTEAIRLQLIGARISNAEGKYVYVNIEAHELDSLSPDFGDELQTLAKRQQEVADANLDVDSTPVYGGEYLVFLEFYNPTRKTYVRCPVSLNKDCQIIQAGELDAHSDHLSKFLANLVRNRGPK